MNCENCNTQVDERFKYAIEQNVCPACGKSIMSTEQLAAYMNLVSLLKTMDLDNAGEVANIVVANFELKQRFKSESVKKKNKKEPKKVEKENVKEAVEEEHEDVKENEDDLEEMRKQAYEDALKSQFGMLDEDDVKNVYNDFEPDNDDLDENNPVIKKLEQMAKAKQEKSRKKMENQQGAFSRRG